MNNKEFLIGKLKEDEFAKLFAGATASSQTEDMYEHWDLKISAKIDVKSLKKQARSDVTYNESFHWVELRNVNDDIGWLYGGADFFAFELEDYWLMVEKQQLVKFIETKCKGKAVGSCKDPYELYQRKDRKDVVVKVKTVDLIFIATKMIKKEDNEQTISKQS